LISALSDNNTSLYLVAIDLASVFFNKTLTCNYDLLFSKFAEISKPILLRSNDTNTRARKKSIDCIVGLWKEAFVNAKLMKHYKNSDTSISCKIADAIINPELQEKAIFGRLSILVKRIQDIIEDPEGDVG
jgi:hypothetical protein